MECGDPDKDPKCDPKTQYVHTSVSNGKASRSCKMTKKYNDRKKGKPTNKELRAKISEETKKRKPDYEKDKKNVADQKKKLEDIKKQRAQAEADRKKLNDAHNRQKLRYVECLEGLALLQAVLASASDGDHPYAWTTEFFDEEFVSSDERLKAWPAEIDVNKISDVVDTQAFVDRWAALMEDKKRPPTGCNFVGKRSLEARCSQRRSLDGFDEWYDDIDVAAGSDNSSSLIERDVGPGVSLETSSLIERDTGAAIPGDIPSSDLEELDKRQNPFALLFNLISRFATNISMSVTARVTTAIARAEPQLAKAVNSGRMFRVAARGKGTPKGQGGMKETAKKIMEKAGDKAYKECIKNGKPYGKA